MSILAAVQNFIMECPAVELVHLDMVDAEPSDYAVALSGNAKVSEDLGGNKTYRYSFQFFLREYTGSDMERKDTHQTLQSFADWVEEQDDAGNYPQLPENCQAEGMSVSNMLLYSVDDDGGAGIYQVQLQLEYTKWRN